MKPPTFETASLQTLFWQVGTFASPFVVGETANLRTASLRTLFWQVGTFASTFVVGGFVYAAGVAGFCCDDRRDSNRSERFHLAVLSGFI